MLIQPTLDALNRLKLHGMALALSEQMTNSAAQQLAFEERIALMLEREVSHRENRRKAGRGLPAGRNSQRHHQGYAGLFRAYHRLRRRQDSQVAVREIPRRR